jgi:hypothetical protein
VKTSSQWSVALASADGRRYRWLAEDGRFTTDPSLALQLMNAEVAALRLQVFAELRGWKLRTLERLRLVPSPQPQGLEAGFLAAVRQSR